jgi:phosphoserine phosphatase
MSKTLPMVEVLTTGQFHSAVHEIEPTIAVFDCDGTLWSGDAGSGFMAWTLEHGLVANAAKERLAERYAGYTAGSVSELAICGEMVQVFAGSSDKQMREAARAFFAEKIERNIFPEMTDLVSELQKNHVEIWAVSSTCDWVVEEGVKRFAIPPERVLAARVKVVDGVATRELLDVPTDEGKVASLARAGVATPGAVFGNSVHDAAMLAIARRAFPVNPTAALVERSAREGWAVYYPSSVLPPR